jgi:hypothetical protein
VNTPAGALRLVSSRLFFFTKVYEGQAPLRKWFSGSPDSPEVNLEASRGGSPYGNGLKQAPPAHGTLHRFYSPRWNPKLEAIFLSFRNALKPLRLTRGSVVLSIDPI